MDDGPRLLEIANESCAVWEGYEDAKFHTTSGMIDSNLVVGIRRIGPFVYDLKTRDGSLFRLYKMNESLEGRAKELINTLSEDNLALDRLAAREWAEKGTNNV